MAIKLNEFIPIEKKLENGDTLKYVYLTRNTDPFYPYSLIVCMEQDGELTETCYRDYQILTEARQGLKDYCISMIGSKYLAYVDVRLIYVVTGPQKDHYFNSKRSAFQYCKKKGIDPMWIETRFVSNANNNN